MIVSCEHHSGMGLCRDCQREQEAWADRRRYEERDKLRENADLLRSAADVLEAAGKHWLAQQIRQEIPR